MRYASEGTYGLNGKSDGDQKKENGKNVGRKRKYERKEHQSRTGGDHKKEKKELTHEHSESDLKDEGRTNSLLVGNK